MTPDAELPLPSVELLDMQFVMTRILNLSIGKLLDLEEEDKGTWIC